MTHSFGVMKFLIFEYAKSSEYFFDFYLLKGKGVTEFLKINFLDFSRSSLKWHMNCNHTTRSFGVIKFLIVKYTESSKYFIFSILLWGRRQKLFLKISLVVRSFMLKMTYNLWPNDPQFWNNKFLISENAESCQYFIIFYYYENNENLQKKILAVRSFLFKMTHES